MAKSKMDCYLRDYIDPNRDYWGESKKMKDRLKALGLKQTDLTAEMENRNRPIPYNELNRAFRSTSYVSDDVVNMINTTLSELEKEYKESGKPLVIKKKPRGRNIVVDDFNKSLPPGENSKRVAFIAKLAALPPVDKKDLPALESRLYEYLSICVDSDMRVGNQACYFALGLNHNDIWEWSCGNGRGKDQRYQEFAKKVQQICATYREGLMQDSKVNPVTGIFWQKNYDGLKDQHEMVMVPQNPLGPEKDAKEIEARYRALPDDDEE